MSAPATNDLSPAPVTTITRTSSSRFKSSIARRSSSTVCEFSAFKTLGRLMVTTADAPSRSNSRLSKGMRNLQGERIHQPAEHEGRQEKPAEHHAAKAQLLAPVVFGDDGEDERDEEGEHGEQEEMALHHVIISGALLPAKGDVVRVDHDEQVQQAGDNQKRVAVLVGDRADIAAAVAERFRDEVRQTDADVGDRGEADEPLGQV